MLCYNHVRHAYFLYLCCENSHKEQQFTMFRNIPPVTKNLIIINLIVWLAMFVLPGRLGFSIESFGGLHYLGAPDFNPLQLFTYMFMHDTRGLAHVVFNMFTLFMFGVTLERVLGSKRFLFFYVSCGIGAALVQELVWYFTWPGIFAPSLAQLNNVTVDVMKDYLVAQSAMPEVQSLLNQLVTIGASGAIYGVLLAFGMLFPNVPLYIMFIPVPIKAKWMVLGYGVIELLIGMSHASDGVAHFAHLGGMIFGFLIIYYWKKKGLFRNGGMYV